MNIFELTLRLKGFDTATAKKELEDIQRRKEPVSARLERIVSWHKIHNPLYRKLLKEREYLSFEDLPIITKKDFQVPVKEVLSDCFQPKDVYISSTSGSSGIPFFFAKDKNAHALTHAIILDRYVMFGITPQDKQARFYGIPMSGIAHYKELLKDKLANRVRFPVFDLSDDKMSFFYNRFEKKRFGYIYGYTSTIVLFAKYVQSKGKILKEVCPSLKCCIVTSEVCTDIDKELLRKTFGIPVINEYGASETGIIAFTDKEGDWKITTEDLYVEVVDEQNQPLPYGMRGKILITHLTNKTYPLIRYEIGDMGIIEKKGEKLILKELSGRVSDMIYLPSGKISAGLTFYYVSRIMLEELGIIKEFIIRQVAIDTFVFDMILTRELTNEECAFLQSQIDQYLEPNLKFVINRVSVIQRPASGKIKHFYSELSI